MASLTGQTISTTYDSLLKLTDNGPITASFKEITDGLGNSSGVFVKSTGQIKLGNYTTTTSFTGTAAGYLAFTSAGEIITTAIPSTISGTGTTNYVPKFTSSSAIGNSLIFDNGTNVGIGTASPATALDVSGSITSSSNVRALRFWGGPSVFTSHGAPLHIFSSTIGTSPIARFNNNESTDASTLTSMWLENYSGFRAELAYTTHLNGSNIYINNTYSSGNILFNIAGSEKLRIASSGNVGIGTTSPQAKLHSNSDILTGYFQNGTNSIYDALKLTNNTASNTLSGNGARIQFYNNANNSTNLLGSSIRSVNVDYGWASDLVLSSVQNNGYSTQTVNDAIWIKSNGNVGIGTTTPLGVLHISGLGAVGQLYADQYGTAGSNLLLRSARGTQSAPTSTLSGDLLGSIGVRGYGATGFSSGGRAGLYMYAAENFTDTAQGTYLILGTSLNGTASRAERMRITDAGNVGIGTTSPTEKLSVIGAISANNGMIVQGYSAAASGLNVEMGVTSGYAQFNSYNRTTSAYASLRLDGSNIALNAATGGNVGIGTASPSYQLQLSTDSAAKPTSALWTIASDLRIKENITPYAKGLKELMLINPINYDYNGLGGFKKGKGGVGIIAQEILNILPDSVSSVKGKLNEGDKEETDILNFNGHELTYVLINAIKEQQAQIEELKLLIKK